MFPEPEGACPARLRRREHRSSDSAPAPPALHASTPPGDGGAAPREGMRLLSARWEEEPARYRGRAQLALVVGVRDGNELGGALAQAAAP